LSPASKCTRVSSPGRILPIWIPPRAPHLSGVLP
jgi:hypothetical protein